MTRLLRKCNESLYSSILVDTKDLRKMLRGSRVDGNKCCGTPTGLTNSLSGVTCVTENAQEMYVARSKGLPDIRPPDKRPLHR